MAVDLHIRDTSLPYQFLNDNKQGEHILPPSHDLNHSNNINGSGLKPQLKIPLEFGSHTSSLRKHKHDDFVAEMNRKMQIEHLMLQDDDKFDFSSICSETLDSPWDSVNSAQSTLWSPLCSNQGSPEGSSPKEPSPPSDNSHDSCWENTYDVVGMLEKMKLDERGSFKYHPGHEIQTLDTSNVGVCSYQSLLDEQIRAIQLSRLRQQQILSLKQKITTYRENHGQFQKKGKGVDVGFGMQAGFLGNSSSRGTSCGTGVFLPRGRTSTPSESRKRPGKGCSTVLIPARVVQALQLHFDQMAATSGPKPAAFPPLHDVLVSNSDGMYSLQKRQSRKKPAHIQNEMILPREWAY